MKAARKVGKHEKKPARPEEDVTRGTPDEARGAALTEGLLIVALVVESLPRARHQAASASTVAHLLELMSRLPFEGVVPSMSLAHAGEAMLLGQ